MMFEVSENFEVSVEALQDLCKHKNIKVSHFCFLTQNRS